MRAYKLFALATAGAASLGLFTSCEKFLDVNQNPNAVLVAPASNLLVAAETSLGFLMGSDLHRYTSLVVQQFSGRGLVPHAVESINFSHHVYYTLNLVVVQAAS